MTNANIASDTPKPEVIAPSVTPAPQQPAKNAPIPEKPAEKNTSGK